MIKDLYQDTQYFIRGFQPTQLQAGILLNHSERLRTMEKLILIGEIKIG